MTGSGILMTGVKVNMLLVAPIISNISVTAYQYSASTGSSFTPSFTTDFGVSSSNFGSPNASANCVMGIYVMDLYLYRNDNISTSFYFAFSGSSITGI